MQFDCHRQTMSKLLVQFAVLNTKFLVQTYTALTLPFYLAAQRPWRTLRLARITGVQRTKDQHGRTVYHRPCASTVPHPYYQCKTYSEMLIQVDRHRTAIGIRELLSETLQLDPVTGKPIMVDDRELTKVKLSSQYKWYTTGEIIDEAETLARGLQQLGVQKGDKVMIYADNSVDWIMVALAMDKLSSVAVTLFSTLGDSGVVYGLNQSETRYLVVGESLLKKIHKLQDQLKHVENIVYIPDHPASYKSQDPRLPMVKQELAKKYRLISIEEIKSNGKKIAPYEFPSPNPDDLALIMYTSGTTGNPKGVMITHSNIATAMQNMLYMDSEDGFPVFNSTFPAFLPMAHLFGYLMNMAMFISNGRIAFSSPSTMFSTSPSHVPGQSSDLKLIQPEFIALVPLVLEKLLKEIYRKLNARTPVSAPIFTYLMDYKIRWQNRGFDTPILNWLVCQKINEEFGGKLKYIGVSSAPLHERTHALAEAALNAELRNAYGATEVTGPSHANLGGDLSYGRAGVPYPLSKYYLDDWTDGGYTTADRPNPRGEIVVGGPSVTSGYYKMPEETAKEFYTDENGCRWFRTGDIGEVFPDGTLKIIDRKKDLTKLANGEFISLGKIESGLRSLGYVDNVCVCTDPFRNEIVALIVPNKRALAQLSEKHGKSNLSFEQQCDDPVIRAEILDSIRRKCAEMEFKRREIPEQIALVKEEWSQENNLLTAAFKMRRKAVYDFYRDTIQNMYEQIKLRENSK